MRSLTDNQNRLALIIAGLASLVLCILVYRPGLSGPFLLDDYGSLGALANVGGVTDWSSFKQFVFGGYTGPSGRPLALMTFLIDGTSWPTDPWPFKRTNLVIHSINGLLVAFLCHHLCRLTGTESRRAQWIGVVAGACWMLHPLLVSTTLYPVQRMAQLAATFVFLGLLAYVRGREKLATNVPAGYTFMTLAVVLFTPLAVLSKENGALLPMLILVLEFTVFSNFKHSSRRPGGVWLVAFLWLPTIAVAGSILWYTADLNFFDANPPRDFGTYQRLLTESRILFDYLRHWIAPAANTAGVFQDHFAHSTGLFSPLTTATAILGHAALIVFCTVYRRRFPLVSFALLFFYVGHFLESTFLNLELYFEHRNYLPAAFLFVPALAAFSRRSKDVTFFSCSMIIVIGLALLTAQKSSVWSEYSTIVEAAARAAPTSARAQQQYSMNLFNAQQVDRAVHVVETAINRMPDDASIHAWRVTLLCQTGRLQRDEFQRATEVIASQAYDLRTVRNYQLLSQLIADDYCPDVDIDDLRGLFMAMSRQPENADPASAMYSQIQYFLGAADVYANETESAMVSFGRSLASRPGAGRAMSIAALLAAQGHFDEARKMSDAALEFKTQEERGELRASEVLIDDIIDFQSKLTTP